jgi:hypothetical protein
MLRRSRRERVPRVERLSTQSTPTVVESRRGRPHRRVGDAVWLHHRGLRLHPGRRGSVSSTAFPLS